MTSEMSLVSNPQSQSLTHSAMNPLSMGPQSVACASAGAVSELILHPAERRMLPVLDFDPAIGPTAAVDALAVLGDHALQSNQAGVPEQVRAISPCSKLDKKIPSTRRARSRARLVLRID